MTILQNAGEADTKVGGTYWLDQLNQQGGTAPGGGLPYAATANDVTGVVGIEATGTIAAGNYAVTFTRPQYEDFPQQETRALAWTDI